MKLSVCVITYNQERFIGQAIESALMQHSTFPFEIVIGDDCSTDGTGGILAGYEERYPETIRVLRTEKNLGAVANLARTMDACEGTYVALLEGDDYWTDPEKIQVQVDFLESHSDFSLCFHRAAAVDEHGRPSPRAQWKKLRRRVFTVRDLIVMGNIIPTCSTVFRNRLFGAFPDWFFEHRIGDFPLHVLNARFGKVGFLDREMATFRFHPGGSFTAATNAVNSREVISIYGHLDELLEHRYHAEITSMQDYWQAVECFRIGDLGKARALARRRITGRPLNAQSLKALMMYATPGLYRRLARTVT